MQVHDSIRPVRWTSDHLQVLDQRRLPNRERWLQCHHCDAVVGAIRDMAVRGAPAIGITAAYGVVLAARALKAPENPLQELGPALEALAAARPTAVNLAWALARMRGRLTVLGRDPYAGLLAEAHAIAEEDIAGNRKMGALGAAYIEPGSAVLTHCNTGSLATGGFGTALGVIRQAYADGRLGQVYAGETRPWLQGARLTAWELVRDAIPVTLIADGAAGLLMQQGAVQWVIVGADRVAANGDVANKIGTYGLARLARAHGVRFMVVAPASTVDMDLPDGSRIPIEHRPVEELLGVAGHRVAAAGALGWNPVFDITPAELVDVLVTDHGVLERPARASMTGLFGAVGGTAGSAC